MRYLLALILLLAAPLALSAVDATVTPGDWPLYRGTRIVSRHATLDECVDAAKALGVERTYTCRTSAGVAVTITPDVCTAPQPPAETQTVACPAGTTGSWTQSRSYVAAPFPTCWTAGAWSPAEAPAGACVTPPPPSGSPNIAALPLGSYDVGDWNGFLSSIVNVNDSFVDVTGVTMRVLTSPTAPHPAEEMRSYSMNYGSGGSKISQPFGPDGDEYWIIYMAFDAVSNHTPRLARYKRGTGVVSDVVLSLPGLNLNRLSYTFSYRAGEQDILYYTTNDGRVRRANVATQQATRAGFTGHASLFNESSASTGSYVGEIPGWLQMNWDGTRLLFGADWVSQDKFFHIDLETGNVTNTITAKTGTMYPLKGAARVAAIAYDDGTKGFWFIDENRLTSVASIPGTQGHSDTGESVFYTHNNDGSYGDYSRATPGTAPASNGGPWTGNNTVFVPASAPSNVITDGDYHPSMGWNQLGAGGDEQYLIDSDYANPYRHVEGAWSVHSGSIYRTSVTWGIYGSNAIGPAGVLLWNGINAQNIGAFTGHMPKAPSLAGMTAGTWWWDGARLYIWMADGKSPANRVQVISGSKLFSSVGFLRNSDGEVRRAFFTYRNDASYTYNRMTYVNQSQDGKIAVFGSNRGVQGGRNYLHVAEMPLQ